MLKVIFFSLAILFPYLYFFTGSPTYVGIIEPALIDPSSGELISEAQIRVLFFDSDLGWRSLKVQGLNNETHRIPYNILPEEFLWRFFHDGKTQGKVYSGEVNTCTEGDLLKCGVSKIGSCLEHGVPKVNNQYGYKTSLGIYQYKPLVVSTKKKKKLSNPDQWNSFQANEKEMEYIKKIFIKQIEDNIINCNNSNVPIQQKVKLRDVDIVRSFRHKGGKGDRWPSYVYGVEANINYRCRGFLPDEYSRHWFYLKTQQGYISKAQERVEFLGSNMRLIEVGDFIDDGQNEWIFQYEGYDNDGYTLFYDNFQGKVEFNWSYMKTPVGLKKSGREDAQKAGF